MINLDFEMKFKSESNDSVSVIFRTDKIINLLINNIQFFCDDMKADMSDPSFSTSVLLNAPVTELVFPYPKNHTSSYHSIGFNIHDYSQNLDFKVVIKFDDTALPDIRVL